MNASDPLAEFYSSTPRESRDLSGRSGSYGAVDTALNELRLPAVLDDDGDWTLESDVGQLALIVDDLTGDFVVVQTLQSMDVEGSSDFMYALLRLNFDTRGFARFGAIFQSGRNIFVITARVPGDEISTPSVQTLLADVMRLSRRLDVLLEGAPGPGAEPDGASAPGGVEPGAAEPPPTEQPPAAAPVAETVFAQPVPTEQPPEEPAPAESYPPPTADPAPAAEASYPPPSAEPAYQEPAAPQQPDYPPPPSTPEYPPPVYQPPEPELPPANWYPDPYHQARLRYWDGQQWTHHVAH